MGKMITTSNTKGDPIKRNTREEILEDGTVVLIGTNKLKTLTTTKIKPKTRIEGKEGKNYYPPLTTSLLHEFPKTAKGKKARDRKMEIEADKKRVAEGIPPVVKTKK